MPYPVFDFTGLVGSGLTASSNPSPSTLSTTNPFVASPAHTQDISIAWTTQGVKALFPNEQRDTLFNRPLMLSIVPSIANATYTLTYWKYEGYGNWLLPVNSGSINYTGNQIDYIINPGRNPWFIQISNVSAGSLTIRCDALNAAPL